MLNELGDRIGTNDLCECVCFFFIMSNAMDNKFSIELKIRKKELIVANKIIYGMLCHLGHRSPSNDIQNSE